MKRISFNRKGNRKRKSVFVFAAAAAVGLAFMLGSGVAHGQDNATGPGVEMPCTAPGQDGPPTIPEETVIKIGDSYYMCWRGTWVKMSKVTTMAPPTVKTPATTVTHAPSLNLSR